MVACQKEQNSIQAKEEFVKFVTLYDEGNEVLTKVTQQIDGKPVTEKSISIEDNSLYYHLSMKREENSNEGEMTLNAFTSYEKYLNFLDKEDKIYRSWLEAAEHLSSYAKESGAIDIAKNTDVVLESYTKYQEQYLRRQGLSLGGAARFASILFRAGCFDPDDNTNFVAGPKPFFVFGRWRNAVSSFTPISIYGFDAIYDRSFFRNHIGTIGNWGFSRVCFDAPVFWLPLFNNRAESWIKII